MKFASVGDIRRRNAAELSATSTEEQTKQMAPSLTPGQIVRQFTGDESTVANAL